MLLSHFCIYVVYFELLSFTVIVNFIVIVFFSLKTVPLFL